MLQPLIDLLTTNDVALRACGATGVLDFCRTSQMSHGLSGRGSCLVRKLNPGLHFEKGTIARDMTDEDVGSGALFGVWDRSKTLAITRLNGCRVYQARITAIIRLGSRPFPFFADAGFDY